MKNKYCVDCTSCTTLDAYKINSNCQLLQVTPTPTLTVVLCYDSKGTDPNHLSHNVIFRIDYSRLDFMLAKMVESGVEFYSVMRSDLIVMDQMGCIDIGKIFGKMNWFHQSDSMKGTVL